MHAQIRTPLNENICQSPICIFSKFLFAQCSIHIFVKCKKHICRSKMIAVSYKNNINSSYKLYKGNNYNFWA